MVRCSTKLLLECCLRTTYVQLELRIADWPVIESRRTDGPREGSSSNLDNMIAHFRLQALVYA